MTSSPPNASRRAAGRPKFTTGSIMRHILVMTGTGAIGLMSIFVGDLANILFLSMLKDVEVVAAVGYASSLLFFATSVGIGLSVATSPLVSPAIGAGARQRAKRLAVNCHLFALTASLAASLLLWLLVPSLLALLCAAGRTHALATGYLRILVPALAPLAVGMAASSVLRSVGDARRAMHVTLTGALVNVALDPLLIFGLGLGLEGAAIASVVSRLTIMGVGLHYVVNVHGLMGRPRLRPFLSDAPAIARIAVPAVLTNIATPAGNAYVTAAMARHGDGAVAAWALIGRLMPVAFGGIYALSGTIGPILGQNFGAGRHERVRRTLTDGLIVTVGFTATAWLLLAIFAWPIAGMFRATGETAELLVLFCRSLAPLFVFLGALFVATAAFNTLGRAHYSTLFNWGRATLGTMPFVEVLGRLGGARGVLWGNMLGGIVFGIVAVAVCYRLIERIGASKLAVDARPVDH